MQRPSMHAVCCELRRLQQALPLHEEEDAAALVGPLPGVQAAGGEAAAGGQGKGAGKVKAGCGCTIC